MANTKQAIKRVRQQERRALRNRRWKEEIKSAGRALREAVRTGADEDVTKAAAIFQKKADKAAQRGVIHPKKAARLKSQHAKLVNAN